MAVFGFVHACMCAGVEGETGHKEVLPDIRYLNSMGNLTQGRDRQPFFLRSLCIVLKRNSGNDEEGHCRYGISGGCYAEGACASNANVRSCSAATAVAACPVGLGCATAKRLSDTRVTGLARRALA